MTDFTYCVSCVLPVSFDGLPAHDTRQYASNTSEASFISCNAATAHKASSRITHLQCQKNC